MMTPEKRQRTYESQTSTARKVCDAVPIAETWSATLIYDEMHRRGKSISLAIVQGCLNHLVADGLVVLTKDGYQQAPEKARPASPQLAIVAPPLPPLPPLPAQPAQASSMDSITEFAGHLRRISTDVLALADRAETLAIEIDEAQKGVTDKLDALKKFRALLD